MTMTCTDYQILAERALRGALSAPERTSLEQHLSACGGCREFSDDAAATVEALRQLSQRAGPAPAGERLRAEYTRRERRSRVRLWSTLPGVALIVALFGWANGAEHAWFLGGTSVVLIAIALFRVVLPRRRRARAALAPDGELIETYRSDLDQEIAALHKARPFVPALLIVCALAVAAQPALLVKQALMDEELSWQNAIAMTLVLGFLTYTSWRDDRVTLPRLERERAGLGTGATPGRATESANLLSRRSPGPGPDARRHSA